MMGDGMGVSQVVAATQHRGPLLMNELPYKAVAQTFTREANDVTDSGAGGTKLSTGYRTTKLFAGMDGEGNALMSLIELARSKGKKVGIVTNAELADATPADFTVHNKNRSQGWTKICQEEVLFGADLFMGGTDDSLDGAIGSLGKYAPAAIKRFSSLSSIVSKWNTIGDNELMWNLFSGGDTTLARWNTTDEYPSMQQQMALSLARLQKTSGDNGFFLMFENTYTDIYGHWNDDFAKKTKEYKNTAVDMSLRNLTGIVNEVKDFDETLAVALKFVLENPDTVLLIAADHETGEMQFNQGWEDDIYKLRAESGSHSNQNVPIFAIGYGMNLIDRKNGALFNVEDCLSTDSNVLDNTICGQMFGALMNDENNSFGGDIENDTRGRSKDTFTVTTASAASSVDFTIKLEKLPISEKEYIQFKIKPYSGASKITMKLSDGNAAEYYTDEKRTQKATYENITFAAAETASVSELSPLAAAHKHAFKSKTEKMDGWYQVSFRPTKSTNSVTVHLDGAAAAGSVIELDDFTVQYASTKGLVSITGDNVSATVNKIGY